jgi:hypothetical protein
MYIDTTFWILQQETVNLIKIILQGFILERSLVACRTTLLFNWLLIKQK